MSKENDNYHLRYELAGADETIANLKQQLVEKDKEIESLNKQLDERGKQLADKQNTIDEINKEFVQAVHDWKALCAKKDNEISKLQASYQQVKTQLAIQELEKVKTLIQNAINFEKPNFVEVYDAINNQIKELKGE